MFYRHAVPYSVSHISMTSFSCTIKLRKLCLFCKRVALKVAVILINRQATGYSSADQTNMFGVSPVIFRSSFHDKVDAVRQNTAGAPEPTFSTARPGVSLVSFAPVSVDDVGSAISPLPDKSSAVDPLPVSMMKLVIEEIAPFLTELFSRFMSASHFPVAFKEAFITPALKNPWSCVTDEQSYRSISNLPVVSKLLERIVAQQLNSYLTSTNLLPSLQSGFRAGHSTETAVLRVLSDLLEAVHGGMLPLWSC